MDKGVSIMEPNPQRTYEEAVRDYGAKLSALMQPAPELGGAAARESLDLPAEILTQRAAEIANSSSELLELAQRHLNSADPIIREGIRFHFIDQAAAELLLGIELLQTSEDKTAIPPTAAIRATHNAAFGEAINAVGKSSSAPIGQGIPVVASYRASESATMDEAFLELDLAVESAVSNISRRVQELGGDIAFDLVAGMQWAEVIQAASLTVEEVDGILKSLRKGIAENVLLHVYKKIVALLGTDIAEEARLTIREWLDQIKQSERIDVFNTLLESLYKADSPGKLTGRIQPSAVPLDSINRASDLIKALSDRFIVLIGHIRKLEDAIRLGKSIEIPQIRLMTIAYQVALLSAMVYIGQDYIAYGLTGILRENGIG